MRQLGRHRENPQPTDYLTKRWVSTCIPMAGSYALVAQWQSWEVMPSLGPPMTLCGWPDEPKGEWCRSWRSRWVQSVGGTLWVEEEEEEAGKVEQNLMLMGDGLWFYFVSFTSSLRSAECGTWTSMWKADLGSRFNGHTLWIRWNFLLSDCLHGFRSFLVKHKCHRKNTIRQ